MGTAQCCYCGSDKITRGKIVMASGAFHVIDRCTTCGKNARGGGHFIGKKEYSDQDTDAFPVFDDYSKSNPPCEVCQSAGTEYHHWAPRFLFGDESPNWPGAWLCRLHHALWHKIVTPSMAKHKDRKQAA